MTIKLPKDVELILSILQGHGKQAFVVGGCVRDSIMGITPKDWDITTDATPAQVFKYFPDFKIIPTGLQHGTVTLMLHDIAYEITTFRIDGDYSDNRHPNLIQFTNSIVEDLARRDFTINAMAYNPWVGLIDPFDGARDIANKIIKCVGNPHQRFREDGLRILRAVRFASRLEFHIEPLTAHAMDVNKRLLKFISLERIQVELNQILLSGYGGKYPQIYKDVIFEVLPELQPMVWFNQNNPSHQWDLWNHTLATVFYAPKDSILKWTMLLHDVGKLYTYLEDENGIGHFYGHAPVSACMARTILTRLRFDNNSIDQIDTLIQYHDAELVPEIKHIKRWLNKIGEKSFRYLIEVKRADIKGHSKDQQEVRLKSIDEVEVLLEQVIRESQCFSLKDLAINGRDLMELGIPQSKLIGDILYIILSAVIEGKVNNEKDSLKLMVQDCMKGIKLS